MNWKNLSKKSLLCIASILILSSSCVKEININPEDRGKYVLNCILKNDTLQTLSLTSTASIDGNYIYHQVSDAQVSLWLNEEHVGNFAKVGYDKWQLKHTPTAGGVYRIEARIFDGSTLTATTVMPYNLNIVSQHNGDRYPSRSFTQNSFELPCWVMILSSESFILPHTKPEDLSSLKVHLGSDHPQADRFNLDGNLLSIIPQADTPAFLFYIRIANVPGNVQANSITFKLQTNYGNNSLINFRTASQEYDMYLKSSFQKILMRKDESDPLIWFDETRVYSNIINGVGIFASYTDNYFIYNSDGSNW